MRFGAASDGFRGIDLRWAAPPRELMPAPYADPRDPALIEALARLEVATRFRDAAAAELVLMHLATTDDGQWLLQQSVAAGLRALADQVASAGEERRTFESEY